MARAASAPRLQVSGLPQPARRACCEIKARLDRLDGGPGTGKPTLRRSV
jgi:hypothetical protein